jgi:hypothetical protein
MENKRQAIDTNELVMLLSKQLEMAFQKIDELTQRVYTLEQNSGKSEENKIYTNRELYTLKYIDNLSWNKLNQRTGIPISTLQYRVRKYTESLDE